jgi:RP/EB family microtubule-associated protein
LCIDQRLSSNVYRNLEMSTIGLMEGAFFVGRKEIMDWVNCSLDLNLAKVEDTASGAAACQLLDIMHPGQVPMHKVNWGAKQDFEFIQNYKILQTAFTKLGIERHVDVDRLISGRYMDNLEFMQWFKAFYERAVSDRGDYDCFAQRMKGKGGAQFCVGSKSSISKPTKPTTRPVIATKTTTKPIVATKVSKSASEDNAVTKENAIPNRQKTAAPGDANASKSLAEIHSLKKGKQEAEDECAALRTEMEGMEKERDFYFEKLRDIEVTLQELEDKGEGNKLTADLFKILYATVDGFEAVDEVEVVEEGLPPPSAVEYSEEVY